MTQHEGTSRRRRGIRRAGALGGVLVLALTGCVPGQPDKGQQGEGEKGPEGFDRYYSQEVDWSSCNGGFECAEIEAPTDWGDASSEAITLAVIRQRPDAEPKGSLFVNPGGPGGSGVGLVGSGWAPPALADAFDIVGWDPRGVGGSTRVECLGDDAKDEFLYGTFDVPYDTPEWIAELEQRTAGFAAACLEHTGELLGHVDTASTARDLDLLRAVIGGGKLNYLGFSYGTEIGATYAELFPENVGHMVLDGAVDPTVPPSEWIPIQYTGFESGLRAYAEWCLDRPDCPFSGTADAVLADIEQLIASVDGRGLTAPDGRVLDSATMGTAVSLALYDDASWPDLSRAFGDVRAGDARLAFALADAYYERAPDGSYANNGVEVYTAVLCVDGDFSTQTDPLREIAEIEETAPTIGRYFAYDDYAVVLAACSQWPVDPAPQPTEFDAEGTPPILVVGTTNDPATPFAWAQSLASQLSNGVLVTVEGEGHTAYRTGNACVDEVVESFLIEGTAPDEPPMC